VKKILLISTNALGDTYITCSAFKTLKDYYGDAHIDMVSSEASRFFLKKIPFNNLFLIKQKSYIEVIKVLREVRKINYDIVFNFFPGQANTIFYSFSKSKNKAGFKNFNKKLDWHNSDDKLIFNDKVLNDKIWKKADNFLKRVSLPLSMFNVPPEKIQKPVFNFSENFSESFDIIIHPFSSDKRKSLSNNIILETAKELSVNFNKSVCIIGDQSEYELLNIHQKIHGVSFITNPEIKNLVWLLKNCELFIGVDSFPLHIADAHNVKTLGIFSITNENSIFQNMNNKYVLSVNEINNVKPYDLISLIRYNKLI